MPLRREAVWWPGAWSGALAVGSWLGWKGAVVDADLLLERARRETGLADFGDPEFETPMRLLVAQFAAGARADALGRRVYAHVLLASLKNRLFIREALRVHPAIAQQRVDGPVFVVGLPRTGTTLLQSLLAAVSGMRTPLRWETDLARTPPGVAAPSEIEAQIELANGDADAIHALSPQLSEAHAVGAQLPEECNPMLMTSFRALFHGVLFSCPDYEDHV